MNIDIQTLTKQKKERIKINDISDFMKVLENEGFFIKESNTRKFYNEVGDVLKLEEKIVEKLEECLNDHETTYVVNDLRGFIDYIEKIVEIKEYNEKLYNNIRYIKNLHIHRIEYEREISCQENVDDIIKDIKNIEGKVCKNINPKEISKLDKIENEISRDHLYAKDIELLKKIISIKNNNVLENYDEAAKRKTISIQMPKEIDLEYIKVKKGSVEYHQHIKSNIPRMKRLIDNINKYIEYDKNDVTTCTINHSSALQDSINIAVAVFNNQEFKAISGKNNIKGYCIAPMKSEEEFCACKVNKLGKLGIGYKRVNDSEKKIFEEINKQIKEKKIKDEGNLVLYSKWEPCLSCYYVISQFCKKYPKINVQVKYNKKYGEY